MRKPDIRNRFLFQGLAGLLGFIALAASTPASAQSVDFEAPSYVPGKTIVDIDGWTQSTDIALGSGLVDNFQVQADAGNKWVHCLNPSTTALYRTFTEKPGQVDLRWRWRALGDSVHFCVGVSGSSGGVRLASRALACMEPGGHLQGQGLIASTSVETWTKLTWYYMRLVLDASANTYTLHIATDSLRIGERVAIPPMDMNGVGPLTRLVLRDEDGVGAVDLDDIAWGNIASWLGESDSVWSKPKNWSSGSVPDSLTHVVFNEASGKKCFLNQDVAIKSITFAGLWKGDLNLGISTLSVTGNADLSGGTFHAQSAGLMRLTSPKAQSLVGPEGARLSPPLVHDGAGTLRLDTRQLFAASLVQSQGRWDFHGQDMIIGGDFIIRNGQSTTLQGLDGRAINVGQSAHLEGISKDNLLDLVSRPATGSIAKGWSISVSIGDSLVAKFAVIGNSRANLAPGYAFQSSDGGNNSGWTIIVPPTLVAQPKDLLVAPGENATFRVSIASKLPVAVQWLRNDIEIAGAKDSLFTLTGVKLADHGSVFSCRVTSIGGSVSTTAALLQVIFPAPAATPGPQEFTTTLSVKLATQVAGAKIYYSSNGSAFAQYTGNLLLSDSTTLRAFALLSGDTSALGSWIYSKQTLPQAEVPIISPGPLTFADSQAITMTTTTAGSAIFYTLDQSDPDTAIGRSTALYKGPFTLRVTTTVRARATKAGYRPSAILNAIYLRANPDSIGALGLPLAMPPGGAFTDSQTVTLSPPAGTPDADLFYLFGSGVLTKYTGPLTLRESGLLKIIAVRGQDISDTLTCAFTRRLAAPTVSPKGRDFSDTLLISLSSKVPGTTIRYTLDGNDPNPASRPYLGSPLLLDSSAILKAIAIKGVDVSAIMEETYQLVAEAPQPSYHSGDYASRILITLKTSTSRALIYYSLDGSTPGPENGSRRYTDPFWLDTSATLKAIALTGQGLNSKKSPLLVENFTFITPGRRVLGPGQKLDLSANYSLTNNQTGSSQVLVDVLRVDSLTGLKGFADIQFAMRLSLPEGGEAFPTLVFTAPIGESRALYSQTPPATVNFLTSASASEITGAGTYFLAIDTLPPQITLSGESFGTGDSTRIIFSIQDNVSNLLLDLERTDIPARNINQKEIRSPEVVSTSLRNPPGSIQPLTLRIGVYDHTNRASFPSSPGSYHFLAQRNSGAVQTPRMFHIGTRPGNLWDLIALPLEVDPPLTIAQLRKNNSAPGMEAVVWNPAISQYRFLEDKEALVPSTAIWLAAPVSMVSLDFPSLQTVPRHETGNYKMTLHKGWNQVANPTLATLYWPVSREIPETYQRSPLKGPHGYDAESQTYMPVDSLLPWRGYFAYYKGGRDTTIELRFQPVPPPASPAPVPAVGKSSAETGLFLDLTLGALPRLCLGATIWAVDGIGVEDESRPPAPSASSSRFWSVRASQRLETDLQHWIPGQMYTWQIVAQLPAQGNVDHTGPGLDLTGELSLPEGYSAWAVSKTRGLRFPLEAGAGIPMYPGLTDSLEIIVGPTAELNARLAAVPRDVDAFRMDIASAARGFRLDLRLPLAAHLHWTLWGLDGRAADNGRIDLAAGIYSLPMGMSGSGLASGMYVLSLEWTLAAAELGTGAAPKAGGGTGFGSSRNGRLSRKVSRP